MRHISQCFNSKLTDICNEANQLEALSKIVLDYLPTELKPHCHVGSFRSGKLIIVTQNPAWATQLRYLAPDLRNKLRSEAKLHQLSSVVIKITMA
ncbi:MAG: DUF721 domain-containing protein [Gammaproteobacteria bacterium]|nr:DUF721 domain-containing protein [Gammaproteobacteria bacterium]